MIWDCARKWLSGQIQPLHDPRLWDVVSPPPPGKPIPRIEVYEDGSAKYICGNESKWVKRPDEGEGKVASIDFYPCENLRDLIHKFQMVGAIRADVASQIVAQIAYDKEAAKWVASKTIYPEDVDECGRTKADREQDTDAIIAAGREWDRIISGKGSLPGCSYSYNIKGFGTGSLDLEYSAIGDKSEPKKFVADDGPMYFSTKDGKNWTGVDLGTDERPTQLDRIEAKLDRLLESASEGPKLTYLFKSDAGSPLKVAAQRMADNNREIQRS